MLSLKFFLQKVGNKGSYRIMMEKTKNLKRNLSSLNKRRKYNKMAGYALPQTYNKHMNKLKGKKFNNYLSFTTSHRNRPTRPFTHAKPERKQKKKKLFSNYITYYKDQ